MPDEPMQYRDHLVQAYAKAHTDYDKWLLTLSGGALALSMTFVKDMLVQGKPTCVACLIAAWACWGASLAFVLFSFYMSRKAFLKAIQDFDAGEINYEKPGGKWATVTSWLNALGGIAFILGVLFFGIFVSVNIQVIK